jgi:hypothetical protein
MLSKLEKVNSATKYPSIETYHPLGAKGRLTSEVAQFTGPVYLTEKVDGTNVRIIVDRDGDYVIGEREGLLYAKGDRVSNPAQGVVEAVRDFADLTDLAPQNGDVRVYFVEVYGGKIGQAHKQYTGGGNFGFRLFDVAEIPPDVLSWPRERIASWREQGGQSFLDQDSLIGLAQEKQIPLVPHLAVTDAENLPTSLQETYDWLCYYALQTAVALDDGAKGQAEGIVLRTRDRSVIRKARFANYRRALNIQG